MVKTQACPLSSSVLSEHSWDSNPIPWNFFTTQSAMFAPLREIINKRLEPEMKNYIPQIIDLDDYEGEEDLNGEAHPEGEEEEEAQQYEALTNDEYEAIKKGTNIHNNDGIKR